MRIATSLLLLLVCATGSFGRTTFTQSPVTAHITSLTDKDATHKASVHPAFVNAGQQAGVQVWRIENFEPVAVPQNDYGKFHKGDSYIVLKTTSDKRNNLSWDIYYWIGSESSQDESGAAAILTVGLDDKFGGAAVQHRETLGYESSQFQSYFPTGIHYLDGGHGTGFRHVTTNPGAEKRLFQIKGKRNVRVRQVDPLISSMNKGDCFVLDINQDIYVFVGERTKNVEKLKAISFANQVRDQDHNGRGRVQIIDQFSSEVDVQNFFTALGSGSGRQSIPEESAGGDDQTFEQNEERSVVLSEVSDSSGSLKVTPLTKPYRQEQLKPQECYILDTVSGSLYVWIGKQATQREKSEAMAKAQQYFSAKNYPSWVQVVRIPQGTEPAAFKQYFTTWRDVGMSHSRIVRSVNDEESISTDTDVSDDPGQTNKTTLRQGVFTVHKVEKRLLNYVFSSSSVDESTRGYGILFQGNAYVIEHHVSGPNGLQSKVYYWLGKDSTPEDQEHAAINAMMFQFTWNVEFVRVRQGEEPEDFMQLFKGRLVTMLGEQPPQFDINNPQDNSVNEIRLFKISGTTVGVDIRAEQVPSKAESLISDNAFTLQTPDDNYVWLGKNYNKVQRYEAALLLYQVLKDVKETYIKVTEGHEDPQFWTYLGGEPSTTTEDSVIDNAQLFEASQNSENSISFKNIPTLKQSKLKEDGVYVLESGNMLFIWLGKDVPVSQRKLTHQISQEYIKNHEGRSGIISSVVIKQTLEPERFTNNFEDWDPQMWMKNKLNTEEKEEALKLNEGRKPKITKTDQIKK